MTKDNWTAWKRDSHFRLTEPSITIYKDGITFNASLNKIVDVTRFLNVMIELNHPDNEQASKVRFVLNNYEESEKNFKITRARTNEDNSPAVIFIAKDHAYKNAYYNKITEGDKINIKIIGHRYELKDSKISIIASLVEKRNIIKTNILLFTYSKNFIS